MSERVKIILDKNADILRLPAIALRGLVVFPGNIIHFEVGRKKSIAAIEWAMSNNNAVFLTAQQDMDVEDPGVYQGRRAARDKIGRFRTRGGAGAQCERSL